MPNVRDNNMSACPRCQYSLTGLPDAYACPECGFAYENDMVALRGWDTQTKPTQTNLAWVLICIVVLAFLMWREYWQSGFGGIFWVYLALQCGTVFAMVSILRNIDRKRKGETEVRVVVTSSELILFDVPHAARELRWPLHAISSAIWKDKKDTGGKVTFHIHGQSFGPLDLDAPADIIGKARTMVERGIGSGDDATG
jgi:hypothetical protein